MREIKVNESHMHFLISFQNNKEMNRRDVKKITNYELLIIDCLQFCT